MKTIIFLLILISTYVYSSDSDMKIKLNMGLNYSKWNFKDSSGGKKMLHEIDPYFLKTISVKIFNFHGLDFDLYYLTNSLFSSLGFSAPENKGDKDEDGIRRFRFIVETKKTNSVSYGFHADFRKFQGTSVYEAYKNYPTPSVNFFPYEGEQGVIKVGDKMSWYTTIQEFSLFRRVNSKIDERFYKFGIYYQSKKAFNSVSLKKDIKNYTIYINGVMDLIQSMITIYYTQGLEKKINKWQLSSEMNFGLGFSSYENQFIEASFIDGSAMSAYLDVFAKRDFLFLNKPAFLKMGVKGNVVKYFTFGDGGTSVKLKKDISYETSYSGRRTAEKGEEWNLELDRYETIWGAYLEFQIVF